MGEARSTGLDTAVPEGLLKALVARPDSPIRRDEVARARRHAADRRFDDGAVRAEIASQLLDPRRPA